MMPIKSKRLDGLGHWPAGKRRHADSGHWGRTRLALSRFLDDHWSRGTISKKALAADLGVSDRAVRRWLDGTHRPDPETQDAIQQWLAEWRESIKTRTG